jgi:hypothetical protein
VDAPPPVPGRGPLQQREVLRVGLEGLQRAAQPALQRVEGEQADVGAEVEDPQRPAQKRLDLRRRLVAARAEDLREDVDVARATPQVDRRVGTAQPVFVDGGGQIMPASAAG